MADDTGLYGIRGLQHLAGLRRAEQASSFGLRAELLVGRQGDPAAVRRLLAREDVARQREALVGLDRSALSEEARRVLDGSW